MLEIHLRHLQYVAAVCKEHIPALTVFRHILVLAFLERFQFGRVITFNPAGLVKTQRLPTAFGTVLIFQTVLDYLELQLPYRTDNLASVKLVDKQLRYTFVHQLVDTFGKLLLFHRVGILDILEHLGREARQSAEVKHLTLRQRIADFERTVVRQTDDISRPRLIDGSLALRHKLRGDEKRMVLP